MSTAWWIGPYRVEGELARGGMGVVYRGFHTELNRPVAIKVQLASAGASETERFRIEAQAAARLRHPNIAGIHEVGALNNGQPFLVMDLIEGGSLKQRLEAEGPLPLEEAARLIAALARAVSFAHGHNILHRDIKPANVLLGREGEPVLTDFGLAKKVDDEAGITVSGQIMGTPSYMPPEQADGQTELVDRRADVYSLGATLYALLTGRPPFEGDSAIRVVAAVLSKAPVSPRKERPEVDRDLETICLRCLEKEPEQRYPTALALAEDLERYLAGEPIAARPVGALERLWRGARRRPWVVGALALGSLTVIAALGAGLGVSIKALGVADRERGRAEEERADAMTARAEAKAEMTLARAQAQLERGYSYLGRKRYSLAARAFADVSLIVRDLKGAKAASFRQVAQRGAAEAVVRNGVLAEVMSEAELARFVPGGSGRQAIVVRQGRLHYGTVDRAGKLQIEASAGGLKLGQVAASAATRDGRLLALGHFARGYLATEARDAATSLVTLWELPKLRRRLGVGLPTPRQGLDRKALGLDFRADGREMVFVEAGTALGVLVDTSSGQIVRRFRAPSRPHANSKQNYRSWSACLSPDGATLLIGYKDGTFSIWDRAGPHRDWVNMVGDTPRLIRFLNRFSFGAEGKAAILVVGGDKGRVSAIRGDRRDEPRLLLDGRSGSASCADLLPGDDDVPDLLAVATADGALRVWTAPGGAELARFRLPDRLMTHCSISSDRSAVLVTAESKVQALDLSRVQTLRGFGPLAIDGQGRVLARLRGDFAVDLYDLKARRRIGRVTPITRQERIRSLTLDRSGSRLAVGVIPWRSQGGDAWGADEGSAVLIDVKTLAQTRRPAPQPYALALSGSRLFVGARCDQGGSARATGRVTISDLGSGSDRHLMWHRMSVTSFALAPDGKSFASGSEDGTVALWETESGRLLRVLDVRGQATIDGGTIEAVDLPTRSLRRNREEDKPHLRQFKQRFLKAIGQPDRKPVANYLIRDTWGLLGLAYSRDGALLATGTGDARLRVWDLASGRVRTVLEVDHAVVGGGFLSDGRLALATRGGLVQVWELGLDAALRTSDDATPRGGHMLRTIETQSKITHAALGGDTIVVACEDSTVWAWDLSTPALDGFEQDPVRVVTERLGSK